MKAKKLGFAGMSLAVLVGGLVATWNLSQPEAQAEVDFSIGLDIHSPGDFYSPLGPYGTWVDVSSYGRCWRPGRVVANWRPYTVGHWEWTDAGWYWVSDEPWSWACYHYGSWVFDPNYGWVWVPGTEWAPAWVTWREAPDYIGWAPCGPGGVALGDRYFIFVDVHRFHERLEPRELVFNDSRILARSRPIGEFRRETRDFGGERRRIVINQGPGVAPIQRATGRKFTPRPVNELVRQTPVPDTIRRSPAQPGTERPRLNQEPAPSRTGREQPQLYREAPPAQPPPTGRQEQRIYREPAPQPTPHPSEAPPQTPRRQVPERTVPPFSPPERPLPPTGFERGRNEGQVPRREEPAPRVVPAPPAHVAPATPPQPPPGRERDRDRGER